MRKLLFILSLAVFFFSCRKQNTNPEALPNAYSNQATGQSASDLLGAGNYTSLTIQIQYMPGYPLDTVVLKNVSAFLGLLCNKPEGITITQTQIPANGGDTVATTKAALLEKQYRTAYTSGKNLALYVLVTDGYNNSLSILGFGFRNTSICLFGQNIYDHSGSMGQATRVCLESSVLEHELGHLLGLVNLGTPMLTDHQDAVHGNHCNNPDCLMYWAIETHNAYGTIIRNVPVLDTNCREDLHAFGGK